MFKNLVSFLIGITFCVFPAFAGEPVGWKAFVGLDANIQSSNPQEWEHGSYWEINDTGNLLDIQLDLNYSAHAVATDFENRKLYVLGHGYAAQRRLEVFNMDTREKELDTFIKDIPYSVRFAGIAKFNGVPWVVGWAGRWFSDNEQVTLFAFIASDPDPRPVVPAFANEGALYSLKLRQVNQVGGMAINENNVYVFSRNGDLMWFKPGQTKTFENVVGDRVWWATFDGKNIWVARRKYGEECLLAVNTENPDPDTWGEFQTFGILEDVLWIEAKHPSLLHATEAPHAAAVGFHNLFTFLDLEMTANIFTGFRDVEYFHAFTVTPTHPETILIPFKTEGTEYPNREFEFRQYGWFGGLIETFKNPDPSFRGAPSVYIQAFPVY